MSKQNRQVGAKQLNNTDVAGSATTFAARSLNPNVPNQISIDEIKEHITTHETCFKNYPFPDADKLFPNQPALWSCDRYYPLTQKKIGAPVFLDQPMYEDEIEICNKKAIFLREKGIKYIILTKETDVFSAMEQLGVA